MDRLFTAIANRISSLSGQPLTFAIALSTIFFWAVSGPLFHFSNTWQLVINTTTTVVTFLMVFLIQNSQNRDAAAMQAKLDELIRATDAARGQFIGIEHLTDTQIQRIRAAIERESRVAPHRYKGKHSTTGTTVDRLLERY